MRACAKVMGEGKKASHTRPGRSEWAAAAAAAGTTRRSITPPSKKRGKKKKAKGVLLSQYLRPDVDGMGSVTLLDQSQNVTTPA